MTIKQVSTFFVIAIDITYLTEIFYLSYPTDKSVGYYGMSLRDGFFQACEVLD